MLDYSRMAALHAIWWHNQSSDEELNTVNSFSGEWQIEDHDAIPSETLKNYLMEMQPRKEKLDQISVKEVNRLLNEVWQGPGSMSTVVLETERARQSRVEQECAVVVSQSTTLEDLLARGREIQEAEQNGD